MGIVKIDLFRKYDLDSTSYKWGKFKRAVPGFGGIKTSGNSTTITSMDSTASAGHEAFVGLGVGDILLIRQADSGGAEVYAERKIVTFTDINTIVVDSAINIGASGTTAWWYMKRDLGTGDENGAVRIDNYDHVDLVLNFRTVAAGGGISVNIQERGGGLNTDWVNLVPDKVYTATTDSEIFPIVSRCREIRVGVKGVSDFAGTDDFDIYLLGRPRW